jgi:DNA-binding NarL/FixJ family response regulator
MGNPVKTILVDDHKLFCEGVEKLLNETGSFRVIAKFHDAGSLLQRISNYTPDLLVVDIDMPGLSGLDLTKRIRSTNSAIKIVLLSMHEESIFSREAATLGANAYLTKSIESSNLVSSLEKVCDGQNIFPEWKSGPHFQSPLSERETQILKLIAKGNTSEQIADELKVSGLTVKTHRRNMMRKLGVKNSAEMISRALEMGYLIRPVG